MKVPNLNVRAHLNKALDTAQKGYYNTVKPAILKGIKYTKGLGKDTVNFAKANPKKAGLALACAGLFVSAAAMIAKTFKTNSDLKQVAQIQNEHIGHQAEIIDALKEDIEVRQLFMDSLHDAVTAAHEHIQKTAQKDA